MRSQEIQERQQRQAEDGEIVALDPAEELGTQGLELIGPDRPGFRMPAFSPAISASGMTNSPFTGSTSA